MADRNEELAFEMIAARLRNPAYQDKLAIAQNREVDLGDDQVSRDLTTMSDVQLLNKYGQNVQQEAWRIGQGSNRLSRSDSMERSTVGAISDSAVSAATALYRDIGNLGTLAYGYAEGALDGDPTTTGTSRAAELNQAHNQIVEGMFQENLTEEIQSKKYFSAVEGELQKENEQLLYEKEVETGTSPLMAGLRREGRNAINALERMQNDPSLAGNLIAEGVGSLFASAPLAGTGGLIAKGMTKAATSNLVAQRVAATFGQSAGAGLQEVSGVYSEAVQDVMSIPLETLSQSSSIFNALINEEGMTPEEARTQLAGMTAETAAISQLPYTFILGFITSKFEAMPIGSFLESGLTRGILSIVGEGIEEAGQGATGTINRNLAVAEYTQIGRDTLEGVGEESAIGALAGMGTAGVAATPAAIIGTLNAPRAAADALLEETRFNDPLTDSIMGKRSAAFRAGEFGAEVMSGLGSQAKKDAQSVGKVVQPATDALVDLTQPIATKAATAVGDAVTDFNTRDEREQVNKDVAIAQEAAGIVEQEILNNTLTPEVTKAIQKADTIDVSSGFADTVNPSQPILQRASGLLQKMGDRKFKPTDEDKTYAASQFQALSGMVNSMPEAAKKKVGDLLASSAVQKTLADAAKIDLNSVTPVAGQEVPITISVAKTNPANVNPDGVKKILEQSGKNISETDKKFLGVASKVASIINKAVGDVVGIKEARNISLEAIGEKGKALTNVDKTNRSIMADGYISATGKKLRSLNDFVSDIIVGVQSPDGTFMNSDQMVIPVKEVAKQFAMFLEHMNNRVDALNRSYDSNTPNSRGKLTGNAQKFRMLMDGNTWVDPENWSPGASALTYHRGSPGSIALAQEIESNTKTAYELYQTLSEAFPEVFDGLVVPDLVQLKKDNNTSSQIPTELQNTLVDDFSDPEYIETKPAETETEKNTPDPKLVNLYKDLDDKALAKQRTFAENQFTQAKQRQDKIEAEAARDDDGTKGNLYINRIAKARSLVENRRADLLAIVSIQNERQNPTAVEEEISQEISDEQIPTLQEGLDRGKPAKEQTLQLYHGTGRRFESFDKKREGENLQDKTGAFFTNSIALAKQYAKLTRLKGAKNPHVKEAAVTLKKPREFDSKDQAPDQFWINNQEALNQILEENGHDGAIVRGPDGEVMVVTKNYDGINIIQQDVENPAPVNVWAGTNENRILSNLAPRPFNYKGRGYFSVEHAYQSLKSGKFDPETHKKYVRGESKKIAGNKGTKTDGGYNIQLMEALMKASFAVNSQAMKALRDTGNAVITHTQDKGIWGKEFPRILMAIRDNIPTVVEEEIVSEVGVDDEGAVATEESTTSEETISDEQIDDSDLTEDNFLEEMKKDLELKDLNTRRLNVRDVITSLMGEVNNKVVRDIQVYKKTSKRGFGYVWYDSQTIYLREDMFDSNNELTARGQAVIVHEVGHIIDYKGDPELTQGRWFSESRLFYPNGKIFNELSVLKNQKKFVQERIEMIEGYDEGSHDQAKEIFAVLTELHYSNDPDVFNNTPYTRQLMETVYGPREATRTGSEDTTQESSSSVQETSAVTEGNTDTDVSTADGIIYPLFDKAYKSNPNSNAPKSLDDLETRSQADGKLNPSILVITKALAPMLIGNMNKRLATLKTQIDGKHQTLKYLLKNGSIQEIARYRGTAIADPETGKFDQRLMELATLAVVDWLAIVSPNDPSRQIDTLEKQGLSYVDINDDDLLNMTYGIAPSILKNQLAKSILKMWGVTPNNTQSMGEIFGIAEGIAAELLVALDATTDYITIKNIELTQLDQSKTDPETGEKVIIKRKTETIMLNMEKIREIQKEIRDNAEADMENSAKEYLFGEERERYSIGQKIKGTPQTQDRSNINLSRREKAAVRKMQNTPHYKDEERVNVFHAIGAQTLRTLFGYVENVNEETYPNGTLRRSIMGKNISIENSLADAETLTDALADGTVPVYYPVGITSVGRHQYQGVNPQSNKILRALVGTTWANVDLATQEDDIWLGVAQAAGLHKLEKKNHAVILSTVRDDFETKYGNAKNIIKDFLRDGTSIDGDAFAQAVLGTATEVEPQVLAAIHTVAQMELAKERGETSFRSSLSVELDGLTNGAANMMVNYGQGELGPNEYHNLERIGYFIGKVNKTVNDFFGVKGNLDLYETVSRTAQAKLIKMTQEKMGVEVAAARRFAGWFGDFAYNPESGTFEMTRNSAKNPMTKVNYGSGVKGVGTGLADDMMIMFYQKLHEANYDLNKVAYDGDLVVDLQTLGVNIPTDNRSNSWEFSKSEQALFRKVITNTIGKALTEAAKETLGTKITELNDLLVMSTNIQAQYLNTLFIQRIDALAKQLSNEGKIRSRKNKEGQMVPVISDIPMEEYNKIVDELAAMSPIFRSDDQTLAIGGFETRIASDWTVLSAAMDNSLNQKPMLRQPEDVGVKALPFIIIGTGDAMMMNLFFSDPNAPEDVLGIFDGLDIPVTKLKEYGPRINEAVRQSWERDVLSMGVENFRGFMNNPTVDKTALDVAFKTVKDKNKNMTITANSNEQVMSQLDNRLKASRARKAVFKRISSSVDQMGGSAVGHSRGDTEIGLTALNQMIDKEMKNPSTEAVVNTPEDVVEPVRESTAKAVVKALRFTDAQKIVLNIISPLIGDTRVIMGTQGQLNQWRIDNLPDSGEILNSAKGYYDAQNDILFLTTSNPTTVLHELVHATTFKKVLDHYEGKPNDAIVRLEALMEEFLQIEGGERVREAQAAILRRQSKTDPFSKAAAVNELMAYVLSDSEVRKKTQNTKTNTLKDLADKVIRLMRRLMGGIPESMFDQVVFNTKVLVEGPVDENTEDGGNGDGGSIDNEGGEVTPTANNYTNYWINLISDYLDNLSPSEKMFKMDEQIKAREAVDRIVNDLRQVNMLSNANARLTFKAIYGVINSAISLKSQPLIAMTNMFNHIVDNMTPEMFGTGPEAAQEYSAVMNAFGDDRNRDMINSISVLLGLSQTSAKFRSVLDQIPEPETQRQSASLQNTLTQFSALLMQNMTGSLAESGNASSVMDMLAATIVEHDKEREYALLNKVTSSFEAADNYVSGVFGKTADLMRRTDRETKASTRSKTRKHLTSLLTFGTNYLDKAGTDLTNQKVKDVVHMGLPFMTLIPIREMVSEIVGTDRFNTKIVALQDQVNAAISGMRQAYREDLPGILARLFTNKPTKTQWKAMFNTIAKTDFVSVIDTDFMDKSMSLLSDLSYRNERIRALESQIENKLTPATAQDAKDKAEQLAKFMTNQGAGKLLVRNAYAIAKNLDGTFDPTLVSILDELISIYAIDMMDPDQRQAVSDLYASDPEAIEQIVTYIQGLNEAEESKPGITEVARLNAYKGYIPNEGAKNTRIIVDLNSNELKRKSQGYIKLGEFTGDPNSVVTRSYYTTDIRVSGQYAQGTMQNVAATYRGVDSNTGLSVNGETTGYISGDGVVDKAIDTFNKPSFTLANDKETWIPVFAGDGTVSGFERSLNPDVIEKHMGREENLAIMLGAWAGRHVEETTAYHYNMQLVDELDRIWQTREKGSDKLFENIKKSKDPIYKESFDLIPQNIKAYIDTKFDGEGMMVRTDQINLAVGYREPSVADMWTGKSRMPSEVRTVVRETTHLFMGRSAMKRVVQAEGILQGAVSTAKDIIIVKSLIIPAMNFQSNIAQLVTRGVPLKSIVKDFRRKLAEVEKYNHNVTTLIELDAQLKLRAKDANQKRIIEEKMRVIRDLNNKMSIAPMIKAGAYKALSEGITEFDQDITTGKLGDYVEQLAEKLPDGVSTIAKYGLVSKSTKMYQVANRATQYGDFLGKAIYYDHLLAKGFTPEDAVAQINEEFVNFTTQPGRVRSGLEKNGLSWFMAFKLRIAKIALQQMRDNPVRSFAINFPFEDLGTPIQDNIFSVIGAGNLDYSTGYEMLFTAPELNPWVNLLNG